MRREPKDTIELFKSISTLDPRNLIPALLRYQHPATAPSSEHMALKYLEYCVRQKQNQDVAVHNCLINFYASQIQDEAPLIEFLKSSEDTYFEKEYALRICNQHNKRRACVYIYSAMGLFEEAVEEAIQVDIDLAIECANKPREDDELRKKLWLRIAKFVVRQINSESAQPGASAAAQAAAAKQQTTQNEYNIKRVMKFLENCDNLLKIEDILPFFPDFTIIDDFKDEICESLEDYNRRINELKKEMDHSTESADKIREDIKNLRSKFGYVKETKVCDSCKHPVLTRQFYLFPCQHVFHGDCLLKDMSRHLGQEKRERAFQLSAMIEKESHVRMMLTEGADSKAAAAASVLEKRKNELDELIASQCLLCGDIMIHSIDKAFVTGADEAKEWRI